MRKNVWWLWRESEMKGERGQSFNNTKKLPKQREYKEKGTSKTKKARVSVG